MVRTKVREHMSGLFGRPICPGTLNVELAEPLADPLPNKMDIAKLGVLPQEIGVEGAEVWYEWAPARIGGSYAGIVLHRRAPDYPPNMVELICDRYLRGFLNLKDGDPIEFTLEPEAKTPQELITTARTPQEGQAGPA
ncbi:MAG: DUF120 domain-containing protein [Chloroflexi bacterium]|nr:DUF120 domain-containing protein [Chloroflexota bacterium]